jgi:hypothetical protein
MGYSTFAIHQFDGANGDRFVRLPDIYGSLEATGLTKVEGDQSGNPERLIDLLRSGALKRIRIRVRVAENDIRSRSVVCNASVAQTVLGRIIGQELSANGDVPGGTIRSAIFARRRKLR